VAIASHHELPAHVDAALAEALAAQVIVLGEANASSREGY